MADNAAERTADFIPVSAIELRKNRGGDNVAILDGREIVLGHILNVFPISNRSHFVSLRDLEGNEIGIVEQAHELDPESRRILRSELERSYFLPKIQDILSVADHLSIFTFRVKTDKGLRTFEVRNPRRSIRSVGGGRYIIKDVDGNRYDIPKLGNLGPKSQNLMGEFV